jgi:hypothetical protein
VTCRRDGTGTDEEAGPSEDSLWEGNPQRAISAPRDIGGSLNSKPIVVPDDDFKDASRFLDQGICLYRYCLTGCLRRL